MDNIENMVQIWKPEPGGQLALKPCPFCGNEEPVYLQYNTPAGLRWMVICTDCMANVDPGTAQQRHQIKPLWNRRAGESE